MKESKTIKPLLKWVGGKSQIMSELFQEFPLEINNYHEIFLGGGSVLITLLCFIREQRIKVNGSIYAYDLNEPLIYMYKNIQTQHEELFEEIVLLINEFNSCKNGELNRDPKNLNEALQSQENYYYWTRKRYNNLNDQEKNSLLGSALFIFLNKTCFRGVFRVGPNGFNVPYGNYKNPEIINKDHLDQIHSLIQCVIFQCSDFHQSLQTIEENDFVYIDPPYAPEKDTSFVKYTINGFNIEDHNDLFQMIHNLTNQNKTNQNKKIMMSNSNVKLVIENFQNSQYNIQEILCKRSINSKNPSAKTKEVIIKNY